MSAGRVFAILFTASFAGPMAARADGNSAYLSQGSLPGLEGAGNRALVDQSGGGDNSAGRVDLVMQQSGLANDLVILQEGELNAIAKVSVTSSVGTGLLQSSYSVTGSNRARINQMSNSNTLESLEQTANGAGQIAIGNDLNVDQGITGVAASDGNMIRNVLQMRTGPVEGNSALLRQAGAGNRIDDIRQYANDASNGAVNSIEIEQVGNANGLVPLAGHAALSGAISAQFIQGAVGAAGYGNRLDLLMLGSGNQAGTVQTGIGNRMGTVLPLTMQGDENQFGAVQTGNGNALSLRILGDRNNVGSIQTGVDNDIDIDISPDGSDNSLSIQQGGTDNTLTANMVGDLNEVSLWQDGMANSSLFDVVGNQNRIDGRQSGTTNSAIVAQNGNQNSAVFSQLGGFNAITINQ